MTKWYLARIPKNSEPQGVSLFWLESHEVSDLFSQSKNVISALTKGCLIVFSLQTSFVKWSNDAGLTVSITFSFRNSCVVP